MLREREFFFRIVKKCFKVDFIIVGFVSMVRVSRVFIGQVQVRRFLLELGGQVYIVEKRWGKEKLESWVFKEKKTAGRLDIAIGEKSYVLVSYVYSFQQFVQGSYFSCSFFKCFLVWGIFYQQFVYCWGFFILYFMQGGMVKRQEYKGYGRGDQRDRG